MKATDTMLQLLDMATAQGITADYVLFDSWFSNPAQLTAIKSRGMDVIAMVKKSSRINYEYEGEKLNIKQIYAKNKKRRGKSKYLLSVSVMLGKENPIPAKIVCVRNKANRKDWLAIKKFAIDIALCSPSLKTFPGALPLICNFLRV